MQPSRASLASDWRLSFAALSLIWGFSFFFIKIAGATLAPLQITLGRMACGTAVLLALCWLRGERLPSQPRLWLHLAVAAFLLNSLPFTLFALAETRVSSVLAGICNAATPLCTLLVTIIAFPEEEPTARRVVGLVIGFGGVLVVLGAWRGLGGQDASGALWALAGAACYGIGWPYARRYLGGTGHSSLSLSTAQLLIGTVELAIVTPLLTHAPRALPASVIAAIVVLGAIGTGLAYAIQYKLVRDVGSTVATMVTYVTPVVSVLAGVLLLGERPSWNQPTGAAIVLAGAALSRSRERARPAGAPAVPLERARG